MNIYKIKKKHVDLETGNFRQIGIFGFQHTCTFVVQHFLFITEPEYSGH
jgi:hypothetical protein